MLTMSRDGVCSVFVHVKPHFAAEKKLFLAAQCVERVVALNILMFLASFSSPNDRFQMIHDVGSL